jgi:hypothetical protein
MGELMKSHARRRRPCWATESFPSLPVWVLVELLDGAVTPSAKSAAENAPASEDVGVAETTVFGFAAVVAAAVGVAAACVCVGESVKSAAEKLIAAPTSRLG